MSNNTIIDVRGEWCSGDPLKLTLTTDMLPAMDTVRKIESKIRSLRSLYDDFVVVDLQDKNNINTDYPTFFQTLRDRKFRNTNTYHVELGMRIAHGNILYKKKGVTLDEVIALFRRFCLDREKPNPSEWYVEPHIYGDIEQSKEYIEQEKQCKKCRSFLSQYWQNDIEGYGLDFAEYEALDYIIVYDCRPDYLCELARKYEELGMYSVLCDLFKVRSHNPVVAQIRGEMEYNGIFGKPDYKKAFEYFSHAMTVGSLLAEYYIAKMYKYGLYVKQNYGKYKRMIQSVYKKYQKSIIECCPLCIALEASKVEQQAGNEKKAIDCCLQALKNQRWLMSVGLGNVTNEDAAIVCQLYQLIDFDPDDMDLLDLLYVLREPCQVNILLNGKQITVCSYYNCGRLIVKCGEEYYRDAVDFLRKHKENDELLSTHVYEIAYMEIE